MPYCYKCGKKNDDDAQYCTKCGNYLAKHSSFEKNIDKFAEDLGRKAEQFGQRMEKKAKKFAKSVEQSVVSKGKKCPDCMIDLSRAAKFCWKCGKEIK
jgi:uncharacterized membrane protein YvbJ